MWTKKKSGGTITDTSVNLTAKLSSLGIKAYDSFNRVDNANAIGTADTGHVWTSLDGTWAITGNQAKCNGFTGLAGIVVIDPGLSDVAVAAAVTYQNNNGIVVRSTDGLNYITARISSTALGLFRIVGGNATQLGSFALTATAGTVYTMKIVAKGSQIQVYLNGTLQITASETFNQTATKVGLRDSGTPFGLFDEFTVEVAP